MKYFKGIMLFIILILFCACTTGVGGSSSLQYEVDVLKREVANLKDQGRLSDVSTSGAAPIGADIRTEVDYLKTNVQRLNESVETASLGDLTLKQQLEFISARLDRLEKNSKLSPLDPKLVKSSVPPLISGGPITSIPTDNTGGASSGSPYNSDGSVAPPPTTNTVYDDAKAMYDKNNYPESIRLFKEYLASNSTGNQAAAAQFYIGEAYYAQNDFELAILEYQKVIQSYSKSSHISTALLKQGNAFQALGDNASAKNLYNKVVNNYPKSYAAGVAKERLKTI